MDELLMSTNKAFYYTFRVWLPGALNGWLSRWLLVLLLAVVALLVILARREKRARREAALLESVSGGLSESSAPTTLFPLVLEVLFKAAQPVAGCVYLDASGGPLPLRIQATNPTSTTSHDWEPPERIQAVPGEPGVAKEGKVAVFSLPVKVDGKPLALVQAAAATMRDAQQMLRRAAFLRMLLTPILAQLVAVDRAQGIEERATGASVVSASSQRLLNASLALDDLADLFLDLTLRSTASDAGLILVVGPGEPRIRPLAFAGCEPEFVEALLRAVGEDACPLEGGAVTLDLRGHVAPITEPLRAQGFRAILQMPITDSGVLRGSLLILKRDGEFRDNDLRICRLNASRLALTLGNRAYHEVVFSEYKETLKAIVATYESADPYLEGHSGRVARLAVELARLLGLSPAERDGVHLAAELHDVGMVGLGEDILLHVSRLQKAQYDRVKYHPTIGAALTAPVLLPVPIAPLILHHHERYDGYGYPSGLAGLEIPIGARILALAEVFDPMLTPRHYRAALDFSQAGDRLRVAAGTQLDPRVVEAFLDGITSERWVAIARSAP